MRAKPLSMDERREIAKAPSLAEPWESFARYEATVQAAEDRAERLRMALTAIASGRMLTPPDRIAALSLATDDGARGSS